MPSSSANKRLGLAVFRQEPDTDVRAQRVCRRRDGHRAPVDEDLAAMNVGHAETGQKQVELSHSLQAGNPENLAALE